MLDMASASLLDGATAAAEAMAMAKRVSKLKNANRFVASDVVIRKRWMWSVLVPKPLILAIVDDAQKVFDHQTSSACCYSR